MPHRVMTVLTVVLGIIGAGVVAAIVLAGADPRRAARRGPRWRRRLIGAGLSVLAALGVPAAAKDAPGAAPAGATAAEAAKARVGRTDEWKHLAATWAEAEEVASGKRGAYPFDREGQKRLLDALDRSTRDVGDLAARGLLAADEADLLKQELAALTRGVQFKRPVELRMATCYKPMVLTPRDARAKLAERLPLLTRLATAKTLQPEVVVRVIVAVQGDVRQLTDEKYLAGLPEADRREARRIGEKAAACVQQLRLRIRPQLSEAGLADTPEWRTVTEAWKAAAPLAESGQSTTAEREAAKAGLANAAQALDRLVAAGMLSLPEADLLKSEAGRLREKIYRNPPTDCQVKCYDMMFLAPAHVSLKRLRQRLPLLAKLAASGEVHREVLAKVLPSIRDDLNVLADPKAAGALPGGDQAAEAKAEAEKLLARIERLPGKPR